MNIWDKGMAVAKSAIGVAKGAVRSTVNFVDRHATKIVGAGTAVVVATFGGLAQAQTDATAIATNASTAFSTIAPITITIVGFYVILKLAKRTVK